SQGGAEQQAQGAGGLVEAAPGQPTLEQVQLVGAHLIGAEQVGGTAEVPGEVGDVADVAVDGPGGVIAQAEVGDEALTKRSHVVIPGRIVPAGATAATGTVCRKDGSPTHNAQVRG